MTGSHTPTDAARQESKSGPKKAKRARNKSNQKGKRGERALCMMLGEIFGGSFIRTPNSGAFIGGKFATRMTQLSPDQVRHRKGDIVPPDDLPRLVIESKNYETFSFNALMDGNVAKLDEWIAQVVTTVDHDDVWFICFTANYKPWYVVFPDGGKVFDLGSHCRYHGKAGCFIVTGMRDFFQRNIERVRALCGPETS